MSAMDIQTTTSALVAEVNKDNTVPTSSLPQGFPTSINGKIAWTPTDFTAGDYIYLFSPADLIEIRKAFNDFKGLGVDGTDINKNNFVLPTLGPKLDSFRKEVYTGRGFIVLRGLDAAGLGLDNGEMTVISMGLASYISDIVGRQDGSGNALVHIIADKSAAAHHRHSNDQITFHTEEAADVVAWFTRAAAQTGGRCVISSAATVYNVLAASRPDLVRVLAAGDWPFAFPRYQCRPVVFQENGMVKFNFGRAALLGSTANPRKAHLPTLSAKQMEALDAIEQIARATEFAFTTQAGDMHFISNMSVLHRRDGFTDGASATDTRHLLRMWLSDTVYGSKIPALGRQWSDAYNDEFDRTFHIMPMPAGYFPLRKYPN